jgi:hypothetical protein
MPTAGGRQGGAWGGAEGRVRYRPSPGRCQHRRGEERTLTQWPPCVSRSNCGQLRQSPGSNANRSARGSPPGPCAHFQASISVAGEPASACEKSHDQQQDDCADGGIDDCRHDSCAKVQSKPRKQHACYESTQYAQNQIAHKPKTSSSNDLSGQPACSDTDNENDQQALSREMHFSNPLERGAGPTSPSQNRSSS